MVTYAGRAQINATKILSSILHLGNLEFEVDAQASAQKRTDCVKIGNRDVFQIIAELMQCDPHFLEQALTNRSISTGVGGRKSQISVPLDMDQVCL